MNERASESAGDAARPEPGATDGDCPIAIVGIGCRYADARGPEEFWEIVRSGRNTVRDVPRHRVDLGYDIEHFFDPRPRIPGKISSRKGGFLEHPELFDPAAFGIAPRDALTMEPQQRLMVEVTWDALEDAGIVPESIAGERVSVILGYMAEDYSRERMGVLGEAAAFRGHDVFTVGGMSHAVLSGRIAYLLGVTGPSFTLDTACSSSLIATHLACQSLRRGESTMALAGGVNVFLAPEGNIALSRSGMLSMSGACKAFDASADGFVRAEGAGVVVLKPLAEALSNGDPIYAVICGSGISSDGRDGGHMMAPGRNGQAQAMRDAYAEAGIDPAEIHYVETHGTGTMIGDPVEISALAEVMGPNRPSDRPLLVGSVKGNLGHTESASGVAGLIKAALSMHHRELPAQLHFETPSPAIPWAEIPIRVHAEHSDWPYPGRPLVGVNSFGISGTNAHVVLESPPAAPSTQPAPAVTDAAAPRPDTPRPRLLPISAHDPNALHEMVEGHRNRLLRADRPDFKDLAYTLGQRRSHRTHRVCVVAASNDELRSELDAFLDGHPSAAIQQGVASAAAAPKIVMAFPGQGSQSFGMGRKLFATEPVFAASIERLDAAYREQVDWSLRDSLASPDAADWTRRLDVLQPVLIATEIALAELWASWGIRPDRVIGQSLGEIAAARIAGALSLEDVALLACHRGRTVARVSGRGAMAVVALSREQTLAMLDAGHADGRVEIAGVNAPTTTIVAGDRDAVLAVLAECETAGVFARPLDVDFASHCFHMDPLTESFREGVRSIRPTPTRIPFDSTVDDGEKSGEDLDADYWVRNLRQPVAFDRGLARSITEGGELLVEVSPHPTLARATAEIAEGIGCSVTHVASLQRGQDDHHSLLTSVGTLFSAGASVDWRALTSSEGRFVPTPLYAYQRKRFWFSDRNRSHRFRPTHPLLGERSESSVDPRLHSWDFVLDSDSADFVEDHRFEGRQVAPAGLYPELALAASDALWPGVPVLIRDLQLARAHNFDENGRCLMQVVLRVDGEREGALRISCREREDARWMLLASCAIQPAPEEAPQADHAADALGESGLTGQHQLDRTGNVTRSSESHFASLERCGLQLGPACRTLRELEVEAFEDADGSADDRGESVGALVARLMLPRSCESEWQAFHAHPAMIESCFQLAGELLESPAALRVRSIGRISMSSGLGSDCWVRWVRRRVEAGKIRADLEFFDRQGLRIGSIDGFEAEAMADRKVPSQVVSTDLLEIEWRATTRELSSESAKEILRWIIISKSTEEAAALAAELQKRGAQASFCEKTEDLAGLVAPLEATPSEPWGLALLDWFDPSTSQTLELAAHRTFRVASWAAAIRQHATAASQVWLATRGMHHVDPPSSSFFGARIAREIETFASCVEMQQCRLFDATGTDGHDERLTLAALMGTSNPDRQFLARGSELFVPRLRPLDAVAASKIESASKRAKREPAGARNFRAVHTGREGLSCLSLEEVPEPTPRDGAVIVDVATASLCHLDVLTGLGMAVDSRSGDKSVGIDYAGTIAAVSDPTSDLAVGDRVFGVHAGAITRRIETNPSFLSRAPSFFDAVESSSLAFPFLVARYALEVVGRLRAGERVLVLSASGGVGQALIQVAQSIGAEVNATASSDRRRDRLRTLGALVLDSEADPSLASSGEFDVIVSSASGKTLHAMLARLAAGGRYIDLCPRNAFELPPLGSLDLAANRSISSIDVAAMMRTEPTLVSALLEQTAEDARNGRIKPIPTTRFPASEAGRALRFMAQNRHEGRVGIDLEDADEVPIRVMKSSGHRLSDRPAMLVTGDRPAMRSEIAGALRAEGASSVFEQITPEFLAESKSGVRTGARRPVWIHFLRESTSADSESEEFFQAVDFDRVLVSTRAAVQGDGAQDRAWETRVTLDRLLLFDVEEDSTGADRADRPGSPRSFCLSIAPELTSTRVVQLVLNDLESGGEQPQLVVLDEAEVATRQREAPSPLLEDLGDALSESGRRPLLRAELISLPPAERRLAMQQFVRDSLASVQGLSEQQRSALDLARPIDSLGLDSLMTMEFFVGMGRDLEIEITADLFQSAPTLHQIAVVISEQLDASCEHEAPS